MYLMVNWDVHSVWPDAVAGVYVNLACVALTRVMAETLPQADCWITAVISGGGAPVEIGANDVDANSGVVLMNISIVSPVFALTVPEILVVVLPTFF